MSGVKKECFAWNDKQWKCDILEEIVCRHKEKCSFYMPKDKYRLKQAQAEISKLEHERIKAMQTKDEITQKEAI